MRWWPDDEPVKRSDLVPGVPAAHHGGEIHCVVGSGSDVEELTVGDTVQFVTAKIKNTGDKQVTDLFDWDRLGGVVLAVNICGVESQVLSGCGVMPVAVACPLHNRSCTIRQIRSVRKIRVRQ